MIFTKEFIINYLKEYYKNNNKIPQSLDKTHPFSGKTVLNKLGSWNNALSLANIPFNKNKPVKIECTNCKKEFKKLYNQIVKYNNHFCSRSCSGTYTNLNRKTGNRISKLEVYLQEHLKDYNFEYNNRKICDGLELDIFLPKLQLGFEINGIFHYKPIFGIEKLQNIQRKDRLKNKSCVYKNITLITIVDESDRFTTEYGKIILNKIYWYIHDHKLKKVLCEL